MGQFDSLFVNDPGFIRDMVSSAPGPLFCPSSVEDIDWDDGSFEYDASRGIGVIRDKNRCGYKRTSD